MTNRREFLQYSTVATLAASLPILAQEQRQLPTRPIPGTDESLAIIGLLDDLYPEPALLPQAPVERARVRAAAELIACDIHPINNLRVGQYIKGTLGHDQAAVVTWMQHWMRGGLEAFQRLIAGATQLCFSDQPSLADLCLIPQLYNARRWDLDLAGLERLVEIEQRCLAMPAFLAARPEAQADAEL